MHKKMIGIRISEQEKKILAQEANANGMDLSSFVRKILKNHMKKKEIKSVVDITVMNALSELLYMNRTITDRIDSSVKENAKAYAREMIHKFKENIHE
ncbi:MAG: hypothetical protein CMF49_07170 [Legionellales bacterium]|nr:hypothetical protein [Legionellales bacterium]|tara:strand:- start:305 stop:598 length:294 start_codon:yes stop_codon:yes gene_type:complete